MIYSNFCDFPRVASDFCNENSITIQEHFKNISILSKNISDIENIIKITAIWEIATKINYVKIFVQLKINGKTVYIFQHSRLTR